MTAIAERDAGEQQVGQCMCVAAVVVDVRRGRGREWLLALSRQLLSPHSTAPASPRARPNPDVGGISPLSKRHQDLI